MNIHTYIHRHKKMKIGRWSATATMVGGGARLRMACGDVNEKERGGGRGSQRGEGSRSPAGISVMADERPWG